MKLEWKKNLFLIWPNFHSQVLADYGISAFKIPIPPKTADEELMQATRWKKELSPAVKGIHDWGMPS